jgi:hypothetical protein
MSTPMIQAFEEDAGPQKATSFVPFIAQIADPLPCCLDESQKQVGGFMIREDRRYTKNFSPGPLR